MSQDMTRVPGWLINILVRLGANHLSKQHSSPAKPSKQDYHCSNLHQPNRKTPSTAQILAALAFYHPPGPAQPITPSKTPDDPRHMSVVMPKLISLFTQHHPPHRRCGGFLGAVWCNKKPPSKAWHLRGSEGGFLLHQTAPIQNWGCWWFSVGRNLSSRGKRC